MNTAIGRRRWGRAGPLLTILAALAALSSCGSYRELDELAALDVVLKDMDGRDVRLADFRGRPLILNFWASWCEPCQREMPQLVALSKRFGPEGLTILGISVDDPVAEVQAFARAFSIDYPLLVGRGRDEVLAGLGFRGLMPTTVFINRQGRITGRLVGPASDDFFDRTVRALF